MTKQPRRPSGSPAGTGGQFDKVDRAPVTIDLGVREPSGSASDGQWAIPKRGPQDAVVWDGPTGPQDAEVWTKPPTSQDANDDMESVIAARGEWAHGGDLAGVTNQWRSAGFEPPETADWLDSGTFDADAARALRDAGITPAQAGMKFRGDSTTTLGYAVSNGDIRAAEAVRFLRG